MCELRAGGFDVPGRQCMDGWVAVKDRRAAVGEGGQCRGDCSSQEGHETSLEGTRPRSRTHCRAFFAGLDRGVFFGFFAAEREVGASTKEVPKKTVLGGTKIKPGTRTTN